MPGSGLFTLQVVSGKGSACGGGNYTESSNMRLLQSPHQPVRISDVVEGNGLTQPKAEKIEPCVLIHSGKAHQALRSESHTDMLTVPGPVDLCRHPAEGRICNRPVPYTDDRTAISEPVCRDKLPPLFENKPAEYEVEAHQDERDAPEHEKGLPDRRYGHDLPEDREPSPQNTERHKERVSAREANPRIGLANPKQMFTLAEDRKNAAAWVVHARSLAQAPPYWNERH